MKIGIIQGSSQKSQNQMLEKALKETVDLSAHEVINYGVFEDEEVEYSYIHTAFFISLLLESGAVDFVVTGCSSGQGMMLACNGLPGVLCGFVTNPMDAFLFGRINGGNAVSFALKEGWGFIGKEKVKEALCALFDGAFGCGFPESEAQRKQRDTRQMKQIHSLAKKPLLEIIPELDEYFLEQVWKRKNVVEYVCTYGCNSELIHWVKWANKR